MGSVSSINSPFPNTPKNSICTITRNDIPATFSPVPPVGKDEVTTLVCAREVVSSALDVAVLKEVVVDEPSRVDGEVLGRLCVVEVRC